MQKRFAVLDIDEADRLATAELISYIARKIPRNRPAHVKISQYASNKDVSADLERGKIDALFLTVDKEEDFVFAKEVRAKYKSLPIVFISSGHTYAMSGYELNILHYLIKPLCDDDVNEAVYRCVYKRKVV